MQTKTEKTIKAAKRKAWYKKIENYREPYYRRVMLLDSYLEPFDDGFMDIYASMGIVPTKDYGFCYFVVVRGKTGNSCFQKWFSPPVEMGVEEVWRQACDEVNNIANETVIESEYLRERGYRWE